MPSKTTTSCDKFAAWETNDKVAKQGVAIQLEVNFSPNLQTNEIPPDQMKDDFLPCALVNGESANREKR